MNPPFSTAQFLEVFARYNEAVWPAQPLFYALAAAVLWLAWRPRAGSGKVVAGVLAFLWAWMGVVYHARFFSSINPAAYLFAALFLLESVLLFHAGVLRPRLRFRARSDPAGIAGAILAAYALAGYPLLGHAFGQDYPRTPTFGVPCPTTIFTFGVLLWAERPVPVRVLVIPAAWAVLGPFAAFQHGIAQDYGLLPAALVALMLLFWRGRRLPRRPSRHTIPGAAAAPGACVPGANTAVAGPGGRLAP